MSTLMLHSTVPAQGLMAADEAITARYWVRSSLLGEELKSSSHSSPHNGLCEHHWPQRLVIRDNAWPIVPKDTPGSLEACDPA